MEDGGDDGEGDEAFSDALGFFDFGAGDESHFEEEEHEHTVEGGDEEGFEQGAGLGGGGHAADDTTDEEDEGFAGDDFVDGVFERSFGLGAEHFGEHHGDEDGRDFHGGHDGGHEFFVSDFLLIEESDAGHKSDGGDGAVVRGEGGGIGYPHGEDFASEEKNQHGDEAADDEGDGEGGGEFGEAGGGDGFSAFEADGEEEVDGQALVDLFGEFQVASDIDGDDAGGESDDGW